MKNTPSLIIIIVVSISLLAWFVSIWQYDTMMSSMMSFYSPAALSLFVVIWTAGMAAMMFPAIIPMVLFYNRLIDSSKGSKDNSILIIVVRCYIIDKVILTGIWIIMIIMAHEIQ